MLLATAAIPNSPWVLAIALDQAVALQPIVQQLWLSAGLTLAMVLGAALLLAWAIKAAMQRLVLAREAMDEVASGDGDLSRPAPRSRMPCPPIRSRIEDPRDSWKTISGRSARTRC